LCCKKHAHILCRNFGWRICEIFLYGHFVWNFCVMFLCFSSIFITKKVCIFYEENLIENFVYQNCVQLLCIIFEIFIRDNFQWNCVKLMCNVSVFFINFYYKKSVHILWRKFDWKFCVSKLCADFVYCFCVEIFIGDNFKWNSLRIFSEFSLSQIHTCIFVFSFSISLHPPPQCQCRTAGHLPAAATTTIITATTTTRPLRAPRLLN
jgi:hypothetical protein